MRHLIAAYKDSLRQSVRRAGAVAEGTSTFEARLEATSPLVGRKLSEAGLPPRTIVVSIDRGGQIVFPLASTVPRAGDILTIVADPSSEQALRAFLAETPGQSRMG